MKKLLTLIALLAITLSVCACTDDADETTAAQSTAAPTTTAGESTDTTSENTPDDEGWGPLIPMDKTA